MFDVAVHQHFQRLDPATRTVRLEAKPVDLTSVEFNLLEALLREAARVVPRERLVNAVLSRKFSPFTYSGISF